MPKRDLRVDGYIQKSAPFAKPILKHLRDVVHAGCPAAEETIKWGMPFFMYEGILASMASFKEHCAFGLWKGSLVLGPREKNAMGNFGRIRSLSDLPPKKVLVGYVRKAAELNEKRVKHPTRSRDAKTKTKPLSVPTYMKSALAKNRKAAANFDAFPPSGKREYVQWVTAAKGEDTRRRRLAAAIEWMTDGKPRNWKYMK